MEFIESNNTHKCGICGEKHIIDKYGWVESCIGYFDLINIKYQEREWRNGR